MVCTKPALLRLRTRINNPVYVSTITLFHTFESTVTETSNIISLLKSYFSAIIVLPVLRVFVRFIFEFATQNGGRIRAGKD